MAVQTLGRPDCMERPEALIMLSFSAYQPEAFNASSFELRLSHRGGSQQRTLQVLNCRSWGCLHQSRCLLPCRHRHSCRL